MRNPFAVAHACAAALLTLAAGAGPAVSQAEPRPCAAREQVVARLAERFGETLQSIGMRGADAMIEVYASEATGTWTILLTRPDGAACLIASGDAWEPRAPLRRAGRAA